VWLGISADELCALYLSRFPQLVEYEGGMWFDAAGRRIAENFNAHGSGQERPTYGALMEHLENPDTTEPPAGYRRPLYKADREAEMRGAHAHFKERLDAEIAAGRWTPPA
jgi:hypothetical protein